MYLLVTRFFRRFYITLPLALLLCGVSNRLSAQIGAAATGASNSSRATVLSRSGRSDNGSAQAQQSAVQGTGVATVNTNVQISGNLAGSVTGPPVPPGPITITLAEALKRGLASNLGTLSADTSVRASRAQRIQSLSALLPNITASATETVAQVNLAAYGFQFNVPPGINFSIPTVVGPFSYSQLQGQLSQSVFDLVQRRNWQASKETERSALLSARDTRELIAVAIGATYLQVLSETARVESQRAQIANAQAVYEQATARKLAGTNAKIDVMRSLVEFQTQQQRLSSLEADLRKEKISFARIIGLPQDRELVFSEALGFRNGAPPDLQDQLRQAQANRQDLRQAESQVKAAELALSAARAERLPSATIEGNYGVLGPNPANTHGVFTVAGAINVPIWQGGRVRGDMLQAQSTLDQRRAELADQRARVEQDVRNPMIELQTDMGQVQIAQKNRDYANETLAEARDRFAAGVSTTVEVVQAQEQVATAESDYIASLFSFNAAKLSLGRATGSAEATLPDLLKGNVP